MIKHYTLQDRPPNFKDGDEVLVDMSVMGAAELDLMSGKVVGKASEHIIDYWIVDFGMSLNKDKNFSCYPFKVLSIPHIAIVKNFVPDNLVKQFTKTPTDAEPRA
jgi:hypothetical protein